MMAVVITLFVLSQIVVAIVFATQAVSVVIGHASEENAVVASAITIVPQRSRPVDREIATLGRR